MPDEKKHNEYLVLLKRKNIFALTHMEKAEKNIINLSQFYPSDLVVSSNFLEREREREREREYIYGIIHI